jgi:hypothetical protein
VPNLPASADLTQFEMERTAAKLGTPMRIFQRSNVGNWIGRLVVLAQGHSPIYLTSRREPPRGRRLLKVGPSAFQERETDYPENAERLSPDPCDQLNRVSKGIFRALSASGYCGKKGRILPLTNPW